MLLRIFLIIFFLHFTNVNAKNLKKCEWKNDKGTPCITVTKTPNSSIYSEVGINKTVITKQDIIDSGAVDTNDILKLISGLDVFQSGGKGQSTSIFTRGSESNHTLVLLNGIAINDQSVTDGLHDFGQDFIQTIQQIEIYKGSSGAHFGPSAIAGAINFITSVDYENSYSVSGFTPQNYSINGNYTVITDNDWHLNFKGASNVIETNSAIADGNEYDGTENYQFNFNSVKWINDNLKFKNTFYGRQTASDYDGSATDEEGYVSDNKMYTIQTALDHKSKKFDDTFVIHYHKYDRQYENSGYLDEYYSESFVLKTERKINYFKKMSFGFGGEYKYDWGNFENRGSYEASTKGHVKDLGIFGNFGYKFNEDLILSFYARTDDHKTTGRNDTYKINLTKFINNIQLGATRATGLRNPTLYELYGTDNWGIGGNTNLNPEKSYTNELFVKYNFTNNLYLTATAYRATVFDQIESNSAYSMHENELIDINQEGLENEFVYKGEDQSLTIFSNFNKSRKTNGQAQARRPDLNYGSTYMKKIDDPIYGPFKIVLDYKYTGKYIDWDGAKNSRQKSTDIFNLSITKKINKNNYYFTIGNLTNERYEKPATYGQDGRSIKFGLKTTF